MLKLLDKGTYNPGPRPSEFVIGEKSLLKNNSGAIPPNVLAASLSDTLAELTADPYNIFALSNTKSSDFYQDYCRSNGITPHPARMPARLVEFLIRFLTDANDLVLDPFAGSNTTGAVAESLARRWIAIEIDRKYIKASRSRFPGPFLRQMSIWAGRHVAATAVAAGRS